MFPERFKPLDYPFVDPENDNRLSQYDMPKVCLDALQDVEPLYKRKEYDEAARQYQAIHAAHPSCYMATVYLGDALLFSGHPDQAETLYANVVRTNPSDYRGYFFRATALRHLGREEEAIDSYAWGLTMRPRYEGLLHAAVRGERALGLHVRDTPFAIRGAAVLTDKAIEVIFDPDRPYWLGYAAIKGAWMGEPSVRKRWLKGEDRGDWTSKEEQHALLGLLDSYMSLRQQGKAKKDPDLEYLHSVVKEDMLLEFVLYEVASRLSPHMVATTPRETQKRVHAFVKRFILGVPR